MSTYKSKEELEREREEEELEKHPCYSSRYRPLNHAFEEIHRSPCTWSEKKNFFWNGDSRIGAGADTHSRGRFAISYSRTDQYTHHDTKIEFRCTRCGATEERICSGEVTISEGTTHRSEDSESAYDDSNY